MTAPLIGWVGSLGVRRAGALAAAAIAVLWTPLAIPGLTRVPDPDVAVFDPVSPALLAVVPVGAVLAYLLAPRLLAWSTRRAVSIYAFLVVAVNALVIGELLVYRDLLTADLSGRSVLAEALLGGPVLALFGLLYVGPFALIPAAISAWLWLWVMRVLVRS